ncbi:putative uncharacterized protein [Firmicutes bacterium CAG:238]|nr:putative uncharacterized protein [Firmicutes bacterium CAG:238]
MSEAYRKASVFVQNQFAGILEETEDGYQFCYDKDYLTQGSALPVSLTLPLRKEPYRSGVLFPFFDGLIPEGWLLAVVNRNWKIEPQDRFGLLLAVCRDSIGDVSIRKEGRL